MFDPTRLVLVLVLVLAAGGCRRERAPRPLQTPQPVAAAPRTTACDPARRFTLEIDEWTIEQPLPNAVLVVPRHRVSVRSATGEPTFFYEDGSEVLRSASTEVPIAEEASDRTPLVSTWAAGGGIEVVGHVVGASLVLDSVAVDEGDPPTSLTKTLVLRVPPGTGAVCVVAKRTSKGVRDAG